MNGKPVMLDDTVNFISVASKEEADFIYKLLVSVPATEFLSSLIFWDEKRPVTTKILRELSIKELANELGQIERYYEFVITSQAEKEKEGSGIGNNPFDLCES